MDPLIPVHHSAGCDIGEGKGYIRGEVSSGHAAEVQACYRAIVHECLQRRSQATLIVGRTKSDAFYHLALRDALRSMAVVGVPPGFRLALVAGTPDLIAIYDTALVEAQRCGIEARRLLTEEDALGWLSATP